MTDAVVEKDPRPNDDPAGATVAAAGSQLSDGDEGREGLSDVPADSETGRVVSGSGSEPVATAESPPSPPPSSQDTPTSDPAPAQSSNQSTIQSPSLIPRQMLPPPPRLSRSNTSAGSSKTRKKKRSHSKRSRRHRTADRFSDLKSPALPRLEISPPRNRRELEAPPQPKFSRSMSMSLTNLLATGRALPPPPQGLRSRPSSALSSGSSTTMHPVHHPTVPKLAHRAAASVPEGGAAAASSSSPPPPPPPHSPSSSGPGGGGLIARRPLSAKPSLLSLPNDPMRRSQMSLDSDLRSDVDVDNDIDPGAVGTGDDRLRVPALARAMSSSGSDSFSPPPAGRTTVPGGLAAALERTDSVSSAESPGPGRSRAPFAQPATPRASNLSSLDLPTVEEEEEEKAKARAARSRWVRLKLRMRLVKVVQIVRVQRALAQLTEEQKQKREELENELSLQRSMSLQLDVPPNQDEVRKMSSAERAKADMMRMRAMLQESRAKQTRGAGSNARPRAASRGGGRKRAPSNAELKEMAVKAATVAAQDEASRMPKDDPVPHKFRLMQAFMAFSGDDPGELALTEDTQLCQLKESPNTWCFGFKLDTRIASFPSTFVESLDTGNPLLPLYARVMFPFEDPADAQTLSLASGDIVAVFDNNNGEPGWWIGAKVGPTGLWPRSFVQPMQIDFSGDTTDAEADAGSRT